MESTVTQVKQVAEVTKESKVFKDQQGHKVPMGIKGHEEQKENGEFEGKRLESISYYLYSYS